MSTMEEAIRRHVSLFAPDGGGEARRAAQAALSLLRHPKFALFAVGVSRELTSRQVGGSLTLDPEQALHLAVAAINVELVYLHDDEVTGSRGPTPVRCRRMGDDVLTRVAGVHSGPQAAAFAAVRQLGGAAKVGIPEWLEAALGDVDANICEHLIATAALAVRHTAPGRAWVEVFRVGTVLYEP